MLPRRLGDRHEGAGRYLLSSGAETAQKWLKRLTEGSKASAGNPSQTRKTRQRSSRRGMRHKYANCARSGPEVSSEQKGFTSAECLNYDPNASPRRRLCEVTR